MVLRTRKVRIKKRHGLYSSPNFNKDEMCAAHCTHFQKRNV